MLDPRKKYEGLCLTDGTRKLNLVDSLQIIKNYFWFFSA